MNNNLEKAQAFALGHCLSDYPPGASYDDVLGLLQANSNQVSVWAPLEHCDVAYIMDSLVSAITRLLDEQND